MKPAHFNNMNPQKILSADYFSSYDGNPVIKYTVVIFISSATYNLVTSVTKTTPAGRRI